MIKASSGTIKIGAAHPTKKTDRQPYCGINSALTEPATTPPTGMPINIIETARDRKRVGKKSIAAALSSGIAPPRPMPVTSRNRTSPKTLGIQFMANVPIENQVTQRINPFR